MLLKQPPCFPFLQTLLAAWEALGQQSSELGPFLVLEPEQGWGKEATHETVPVGSRTELLSHPRGSPGEVR